jgi:hypothetical protein
VCFGVKSSVVPATEYSATTSAGALSVAESARLVLRHRRQAAYRDARPWREAQSERSFRMCSMFTPAEGSGHQEIVERSQLSEREIRAYLRRFAESVLSCLRERVRHSEALQRL